MTSFNNAKGCIAKSDFQRNIAFSAAHSVLIFFAEQLIKKIHILKVTFAFILGDFKERKV